MCAIFIAVSQACQSGEILFPAEINLCVKTGQVRRTGRIQSAKSPSENLQRDFGACSRYKKFIITIITIITAVIAAATAAAVCVQ
jgi:hypothetical protein